MRHRSSAFLALFASTWLAAVACDDDYPLPPTACDDWCFATQRAHCGDDSPDGCVASCEEERPARDAGGCAEAWQTMSTCLLHAPASAFSCDGDASQPTTACVAERRAYVACIAPAGGRCFDLCQASASACGASLRDCESNCQNVSAACADSADAYYACALGVPLDCQPAGGPCYYPALEFLACVGY